jgi:hypothetical protein
MYLFQAHRSVVRSALSWKNRQRRLLQNASASTDCQSCTACACICWHQEELHGLLSATAVGGRALLLPGLLAEAAACCCILVALLLEAAVRLLPLLYGTSSA